MKKNYLLTSLVVIGLGITLLFLFQSFQLTGNKQSARLFLAFEMFLGVGLLFVPEVLAKFVGYTIPNALKILYWAFIYFAVFIGTGFHYYNKIKLWDKFLHAWSAALLVALGLALISLFFEKEALIKMSPLFIVLFGFFFALSIGVFWEFYEFTFDRLLGMNMQRFATSTGVDFNGRQALMDTMGDLFTNALGAFLFALYAYIKLKKEPRWIEIVSFRKIKRHKRTA
ncbi:hypothetical protein ACWN8V_01485 [Vagococcus elongatus]|uniref:Uncharacterized protein n=1 Tax=Vagococcus elongatus TaxID=180344 RepID=A0A430B4M8_9ENTE|nr:hypothetical protein [Vagococcus elongatus]RSU15277.1 hypothetical protein CBF29_02790 [Vagococcus elongatus]